MLPAGAVFSQRSRWRFRSSPLAIPLAACQPPAGRLPTCSSPLLAAGRVVSNASNSGAAAENTENTRLDTVNAVAEGSPKEQLSCRKSHFC